MTAFTLLSLKPIRLIVTIFQSVTLPGFKFTIWLGWILGVVFTKNPRNFAVFTSWKSLHVIFPLVFNACIAFLTLNFALHIMPFIVGEGAEINPFVAVVTQGFEIIYATIFAITRAYLVVNVKSFSSFFKNIENWCNRSAVPRKAKRNSQKTGILVVLVLIAVTIQSVFMGLINSTVNRDQSWFCALGNNAYVIIAVIMMTWPMYTSLAFAFAVTTSSMDRMLGIFEEVCDHVESLVPSHLYAEEVGPILDGRLYVKPRPKERVHGPIQYVHIRPIVDQFYAVQSLFLAYNRLVGPLILLMIFISTMGTIDVMTEFLKPKDEALSVIYSWLMVLEIVEYGVYFTLLDYGYRSSNLVRNLAVLTQLSLFKVASIQTMF